MRYNSTCSRPICSFPQHPLINPVCTHVTCVLHLTCKGLQGQAQWLAVKRDKHNVARRLQACQLLIEESQCGPSRFHYPWEPRRSNRGRQPFSGGRAVEGKLGELFWQAGEALAVRKPKRKRCTLNAKQAPTTIRLKRRSVRMAALISSFPVFLLYLPWRCVGPE